MSADQAEVAKAFMRSQSDSMKMSNLKLDYEAICKFILKSTNYKLVMSQGSKPWLRSDIKAAIEAAWDENEKANE